MVYYIAPSLVVRLFYGASYEISGIIGLFGLGIAFYSLSNVVVWYNLAVKKRSFIWLVAACLLTELVAIIYFHGSLLEVVKVLVITNALLFVLLLTTIRQELGFHYV